MTKLSVNSQVSSAGHRFYADFVSPVLHCVSEASTPKYLLGGAAVATQSFNSCVAAVESVLHGRNVHVLKRNANTSTLVFEAEFDSWWAFMRASARAGKSNYEDVHEPHIDGHTGGIDP